MTKKKFDWPKERRKFLDANPDLDQMDKDLTSIEQSLWQRDIENVQRVAALAEKSRWEGGEKIMNDWPRVCFAIIGGIFLFFAGWIQHVTPTLQSEQSAFMIILLVLGSISIGIFIGGGE